MRVLWSAPLDGAPAAASASEDGRIFVPLSPAGLVAVQADTGATLWKAEVTTTQAPAAADGRVYVVSADALQALDATTGGVAWRVSLDAAVSAPIAARGGWVIASLANSELLAVRGTDGTIVWRRTLDAPVVAAPAIDGDRLYLPGEDGSVRALALTTGEPQWSRHLGGRVLSVAPLGGRLYVSSTDKFFYCLDDTNGRVRWRWRTGADTVGVPIADDSRVYVAALDTVLRALDRGHGAQRWRQPLPWRPRTGVIQVGSTLVATGIAVDLRGFEAATGKSLGSFALSEAALDVVVGGLIVVPRQTLPGDFLVAALADGRLVALEHAFGLPGTPLKTLPGEPVALTPPS